MANPAIPNPDPSPPADAPTVGSGYFVAADTDPGYASTTASEKPDASEKKAAKEAKAAAKREEKKVAARVKADDREIKKQAKQLENEAKKSAANTNSQSNARTNSQSNAQTPSSSMLSFVSEPTSTASLSPANRVEAACLELVGAQVRKMLFVTIPLVAAVIGALWRSSDHGPALLWAGLAVASSIVLWYVSGFDVKLDVPQAIASRRTELMAATGFAGLSWAIGSWFMFGAVIDVRYRLLLAVASFGVLGATALGTLLSKPIALAFAAPVVLSTVTRFLFGSSFERSVALVSVVLVAIYVMHFLQSSTTQTTLIRNRLENELLGRKLARMHEVRLLAEAELDRLNDHVERENDRDEVTGVKNRGAFREELGEKWQAADAGFDPFTVVLVEIDQYDEISSRHGQNVADELLRQTANLIDSSLRTDDMIARLGHAQFGLILSNALVDGARICMDRIRKKVSTTPFDAGEPLVISIASSIVTWEVGVGLRELFAAADRTLQEAKAQGTDQMKVWVNPNRDRTPIPTAVMI